MGEKGAKMSNESAQMAELLTEKFNEIGNITAKKMFGGHGIFNDGTMFCIVDSKGQSFLKIDEKLKSELEAKGAHKHGRMPYFSIPEQVLENDEELIDLAKRTIAASK